MTRKPMIRKDKINLGCLKCSNVTQKLRMNRVLAVGFGDVSVTMDGYCVYSEHQLESEDYPKVQFYEDEAKKYPEKDWRIHFFSPLHEEEYQRQGDGNWVIIYSGTGFA